MTTIFTRIIAGEIPGTFVWRDDRCVAFLSVNPMAHGHTLVVPIEEVDHWIDASPDLTAHLFSVVREIGVAQHAAFACERVGVIVAGYEVPHCHIHVIPTNAHGRAVVRQRGGLGRTRRARQRRRGDPRRASPPRSHGRRRVGRTTSTSGSASVGVEEDVDGAIGEGVVDRGFAGEVGEQQRSDDRRARLLEVVVGA